MRLPSLPLRSGLAFVLALAAATSALADNARLEAAKRLYQRAELDAAMAELKAAEESSKDDNDLVTILIYKGLVFAETGQGAQMQDSFKRALAMRPWAEVPPDASPRLAKMFQDARREVWGSSIKAWPKKKDGSASNKPSDKPAEPPASSAPPTVTPAPAPAEAPAKPPEAAQPDAPAAAPAAEPAEKPADKPAEKPTEDAPPDVPPSK